MGIIRTTTLAIGASLLGSVPATFFIKLEVLPWTLLAIGILFLFHGTGFLQEYVVKITLRGVRKKWPIVAIISDLPWTSNSPEKRTHTWAWSKMDPVKWKDTITKDAEESKIKVKVKCVKITRPWVRFFIDKYNIILNPYGSTYPEINIKTLPILNAILDYVLNGGIFVSVSDIPFYWAYDPQREVFYDLVKYSHQYVPVEYESSGSIFRLKSGYIQSFGPFPETPFLSEVKLNVINTEKVANSEIEPLNYSLKLKDSSLKTKELSSVAINRVAVVDRRSEYKGAAPFATGRVESIVEELNNDGQAVTPICYINFGKGRFLVSLVFLDYDKQSDNTKMQVTNLLSELILKEIPHRQ